MDIIKQLELYRLENRITQVDLAKDLKVAFSTVSRWLNGKTTPNKIQQYHIEKFLAQRFGSSALTTSRKAVVWPPIANAMGRSNKVRSKKADM
ncbi:MAG: helix-turn-helix domain-containing protein [Candidatus Omnitrophica bacterium]|nr:helix-turn-helix domain-containing protein [Candidatus Omnitrophota bacterium]MBU4478190.1 helix-turn-helix domain-containing protein [Candidatus Omnitrophota bacterium]MCG2703814.1 helix-turn-helix domain-containing protein [Candidatus Omnitrophota bacterium]